MADENVRKTIVLIDGVCHFCHSSAQFIIRRDPRGIFHFASLQSSLGQQLLKKHALTELNAGLDGSVVLIEDGAIYTKSDAVLRICRKLNGLWPICYVGIIVPRFIRDFMYKHFAKNRYRLFGKAEACIIPDPEIRQRFLDT